MKAVIALLLLVTAGSATCASGADQAARGLGKQVFDRWCRYCHAPESRDASGPRFPGTASLAARYGGQVPAALEERTELTPEVVRYFVRFGVLTMPAFRKTEITDVELAALGAYLSRAPAK